MQAIKKSSLRWHIIVLSILARHSAQSVAGSTSRKFRENHATRSRKKMFQTRWDAQGAHDDSWKVPWSAQISVRHTFIVQCTEQELLGCFDNDVLGNSVLWGPHDWLT